MALLSSLYSQFFVHPTLPDHDFSNQTIIVTGSNVGLGFEAAKHFLALHCSKIIVAVRSTSKGESAKQSLLETIPSVSPSQIEVWALDLSSFKSVRAFAERASSQLGRVDVLVENAGLEEGSFMLTEDGWESTLQINVISTCLLAILMLPKLRETAERFKVTPHLVVVTSDTHYWAKFEERNAEGGILKALNEEEKFNRSDRYSTTKLLEILFIRELAQRLNSPQTFKDHKTPSPNYSPVFTLPTPGLCYTPFFDRKEPPKKAALHLLSTAFHYLHLGMIFLMSRRPDVGARTTVTAACAGQDADGEFMMDGKVTKVVGWVEAEEGRRVQKRVFEEILGAIGVKEEGILV